MSFDSKGERGSSLRRDFNCISQTSRCAIKATQSQDSFSTKNTDETLALSSISCHLHEALIEWRQKKRTELPEPMHYIGGRDSMWITRVEFHINIGRV